MQFLARLASCSLTSPDGDTAIENQWFKSVLCLVQSGELPNEESMINRQAMCKALPLLESSGLKPGSGLHKWCGAISVAAPSPVDKPSQSGVIKKDCPEWFKSILRSTQFLDRVLKGAAAAATDKVLVPGKDFSASAVVQALEKLGVIPKDKNRKTMQAAVREFYNTYKWESRAAGKEKADSLVEHYRRGEAIAKQVSDAKASQARTGVRTV